MRARGVVGAALLVTVLVAGCSAPAPVTATTAPAAPTAPAVPTVTPSGALLWPFADVAAAQEWQRANQAGGAQPWHLDPGATALGFVRGYLGFTELDRVTSLDDRGGDAWAGVGNLVPNGATTTAAVVHLQRLGAGPDAPWEVVGTRDTTLTLDSPGYGTRAAWPLTAGGTISGVDESLHVRVIGPDGPVADTCCTPAGGDSSPWRMAVPQQRTGTGTGTGTLTVVVSTGGHLAEVERFAVTAVRT